MIAEKRIWVRHEGMQIFSIEVQPCGLRFATGGGDQKVVMPTVNSDVAFGLGKINLADDEVRSRVSQALHVVGLADYMKRSVQTLSGGQKERVAIAGALAEACKVLLLDELTTFLDETDQVFESDRTTR